MAIPITLSEAQIFSLPEIGRSSGAQLLELDPHKYACSSRSNLSWSVLPFGRVGQAQLPW